MQKTVKLKDLRPNNWFINSEKLDKVREAWLNDQQNILPPVLISRIDGILALIDGHSRAFAAFENGQNEITADIRELDDIEGSRALYEHIHRQGPGQGIRTIANLASRIVSPQKHRLLWINYCTRWLEEHSGSGNVRLDKTDRLDT